MHKFDGGEEKLGGGMGGEKGVPHRPLPPVGLWGAD